MSSSTPKKPVLIREKKTSSAQLSVSDVCRLFKCSFKTIYRNFISKNIPGERPAYDSLKTSYISPENIFNVSCRRGEESKLYMTSRTLHVQRV